MLSRNRANAMADWLVEHGANRTRLKTKGYGEPHPVADNSTEDGRAKNRLRGTGENTVEATL